MKSPIRENVHNFKALNVLRGLIPPGSVIHSYAFYDGGIEFGLASDRRFVVAHTSKYPVYEFWECALTDPYRIVEMANHLHPLEENTHKILQENWPTYRDPYLRAGLFFLLNRCSDTGLVSSGILDNNRYSQIAAGQLTSFRAQNFHLLLDKEEDLCKTLAVPTGADWLFIPAGNFDYGFLQHGKIRSFETTAIPHQKLYETLREVDKSWIVLYNFHPQVADLYKEYKQIMIDNYGNSTDNAELCKELVIVNS